MTRPRGTVRTLLGAALLLSLLSSPSVPAQPADEQVVLEDVATTYGSEAWKDQPAVAPGAQLPLGAGPVDARVVHNPYFDERVHQGAQTWLGLRLEGVVTFDDVPGTGLDRLEPRVEVLDVAGPRGGDVHVPALIAREAPGRFSFVLDLDGENGREDVFPPIPAGGYQLSVRIVTVDLAGREGDAVAERNFPLRVAAGGLVGRTVALPEAALPGYGDAAPGPTARLLDTTRSPDEVLELVARFAPERAGTTIKVVAVASGHEPVELANGALGANGTLATALDPSRAWPSFERGLVSISAHLTGEASDGIVTGGTPLLVAFAPETFEVTRMQMNPGPTPAELLQIELELDGGMALGSLATGPVVAVNEAGEVIAQGIVDPSAQGGDVRALLPVDGVRSANVTHYSIFTFLTRTDGSFHHLARADRGIALDVRAPRLSPGQEGLLNLTAISLNSNHNDARDEGLAATVRLAVHGTPGGNWSDEVRLSEGARGWRDVPLPASAAGSFDLTVVAEMDELRLVVDQPLTIGEGEDRGGLLGTPIPLWALLAAWMVAGGLARRRFRREG